MTDQRAEENRNWMEEKYRKATLQRERDAIEAQIKRLERLQACFSEFLWLAGYSGILLALVWGSSQLPMVRWQIWSIGAAFGIMAESWWGCVYRLIKLWRKER